MKIVTHDYQELNVKFIEFLSEEVIIVFEDGTKENIKIDNIDYIKN